MTGDFDILPNCNCLYCRPKVTVTPLYTQADLDAALLKEREKAYCEGKRIGQKIGWQEAYDEVQTAIRHVATF